jgi:hypothetical protein
MRSNGNGNHDVNQFDTHFRSPSHTLANSRSVPALTPGPATATLSPTFGQATQSRNSKLTVSIGG